MPAKFIFTYFYIVVQILVKLSMIYFPLAKVSNIRFKSSAQPPAEPVDTRETPTVDKQLETDTFEKSTQPVEDTKVGVGTFADKTFIMKTKNGLTSHELSGAVGDVSFNIKHQGKLFQSDKITGKINFKPIDLDVRQKFLGSKIQGYIGENEVNLNTSERLFGYKISGKFNNQDINIKLKMTPTKFKITGDGIQLEAATKNWFSDDFKINGSYEADPDLIPIIMDFLHSLYVQQTMLILALTV